VTKSAASADPGVGVRLHLLLVLAAGFCTWGMYLGLNRAPVEKTLKMTQKIFYFHAPIGMWTLIVSVAAAAAGGLYLWKRSPRMDLACESCVALSVFGSAISIITGCLWAKPAWGDWFPWSEPRVTTMLVLFLIGLGYKVLRSSVDDPEQRARYSSVLALVGAANAVLAYAAIHIWNTTHPTVITATEIRLPRPMLEAFLVCIVGLGLTFWLILETRYRLVVLQWRTERLEHELEDRRTDIP
jgi:heme exporter protein C